MLLFSYQCPSELFPYQKQFFLLSVTFSLTAYLYYHIHFSMSSIFSTFSFSFCEVIFVVLRQRNLYYHNLFCLSTTFFIFSRCFFNISCFPATQYNISRSFKLVNTFFHFFKQLIQFQQFIPIKISFLN